MSLVLGGRIRASLAAGLKPRVESAAVPRRVEEATVPADDLHFRGTALSSRRSLISRGKKPDLSRPGDFLLATAALSSVSSSTSFPH